MSVYVSKRGESRAQFIDTARELEVYSLGYLKKFNKSDMFIITKELVDLVKDVYNNVIRGNSIYVKYEEDLFLRRECFYKAYGSLRAFISQLSIAKDFCNLDFKDSVWHKWMDLAEQELKLLKGVLEKDSLGFNPPR